MTPAQKNAVKNHRKRQKEKGFVRLEVNVPEADKDLVRQLAANLRAGGVVAQNTRSSLAALANPYAGMDLKQLLEAGPLNELDLERSKETWRDIEL